MDRQNPRKLIPAKIFHKKSIPYSQVLRFSRICSKEDDYQRELGELLEKFQEKGYKDSDIIEQFNKASNKER